MYTLTTGLSKGHFFFHQRVSYVCTFDTHSSSRVIAVIFPKSPPRAYVLSISTNTDSRNAFAIRVLAASCFDRILYSHVAIVTPALLQMKKKKKKSLKSLNDIVKKQLTVCKHTAGHTDSCCAEASKRCRRGLVRPGAPSRKQKQRVVSVDRRGRRSDSETTKVAEEVDTYRSREGRRATPPLCLSLLRVHSLFLSAARPWRSSIIRQVSGRYNSSG